MNSKFNLKLALKILLGTVGVVLLLAVAGIAYFIHGLPSASEIAQNLKGQAPDSKPPVEADHSKLSGSSTESTAPKAQDESEQLTAEEEAFMQEQKAEQMKNIERMIEEDSRDIRVCNLLGKESQLFQNDEEEEDFDFGQAFSEKREDPEAEAFRVPIRAILQDSELSSLLKRIQQVEEQKLSKEQKDSFLDKIGFYSEVATTAAHLYQKREQFEYLGNRAVHLGLIAKVAAAKPELATDPMVKDFCYRIQNSLADNKTVDVHQERQQVLDLIRYAGLTPEDLNFDPEDYIKFSVKSSHNSFEFSLSDKDSEAQNESSQN